MLRNPYLDDEDEDVVKSSPKEMSAPQKFAIAILSIFFLVILGFVGMFVLREPIADFFATEKLREQERLEQQERQEDSELLLYSVGNKMVALNDKTDEIAVGSN